MTTLLFIGGLGPPELLLIAGVLILLFGASKLPKLARSMGSATGEFKKGRQEVEEELEEIQEGGTETSEPDVAPDSEPGGESGADVEADEIESERDPEQTGA
jgi:sec-independent protein translocase protein TatA